MGLGSCLSSFKKPTGGITEEGGGPSWPDKRLEKQLKAMVLLKTNLKLGDKGVLEAECPAQWLWPRILYDKLHSC